jgi:osmotically-inducible protein OsmY
MLGKSKLPVLCLLFLPLNADSDFHGFKPPHFNQMGDAQMQNEMRQNNTAADRYLAEKIQIALRNLNPYYQNIGVEVHGSQVTLRGTVVTLKESQEIERIVGQIDGVYIVTNFINVLPDRGI